MHELFVNKHKLPILEAYIIRTAWHPPLTEHCHVFAWAVNSRQLNILSLFALKLLVVSRGEWLWKPANFKGQNNRAVSITVGMPRAWSKCGRKLQTLLFINISLQMCWYCSRNSPRRMILFITIVSRGEWLWKPANFKGQNNRAVSDVEKVRHVTLTVMLCYVFICLRRLMYMAA